MKKDYRLVKILNDKSGFGWDAKTGSASAPNSVWNDLILANMALAKWRDRPFPMYDTFAKVFDGSMATGGAAVPLNVAAASSTQPIVQPENGNGSPATQPSPSVSDGSPVRSEPAQTQTQNLESWEHAQQETCSDSATSSSADIFSSPVKKRRTQKQPTPRSAGMMIASTLEKLSERIGMQGGSVAAAPSNPSLSTLPAAEQSVIETALAIIHREFVDVWPADDAAIAFDVVSDPKRAFLFTRMTHTSSREA